MNNAAVKAPPRHGLSRRRQLLTGGLVLGVTVLVFVCFASIALGSRSITLETGLQALLSPSVGSADILVIRDMRLPRTILGLAVGAALALSGVLLQGVARNPLADPGIMGINAGAAVSVVVGISIFGTQTVAGYVWFAFAGAGIAVVLVYTIASFGREGATPVKLALAGVVVTAAFSSITSAIVLTNVSALNELRFWQVGALAGRYMPVVEQLGPYLALGICAALPAGRSLNALALGDEMAAALGQRPAVTRFIVFAIVAVLCGSATAACGPISFVGLMVPHLARLICGPDYRWILPYSLVLGPIVLLLCDIAGRVVSAPGELQVAIVIGVVGAPVFVALVRHRRVVEM